MITADQARELVSTSDSSVDKELKMIEQAIIEAANAGKSCLEYTPRQGDMIQLLIEEWKTVAAPPIATRIVAELQKLGFSAQFGIIRREQIAGPSLADLGSYDADPKMGKVIGLTVSW